MIWEDAKMVATDLETSGEITGVDENGKPTSAYALQPWRVRQGKAWITSASLLRFDAAQGLVAHVSQLMPHRDLIKQMLLDCIANDWWVVGWNITFDVSMMMALGRDIEELCFQVKWFDGMLAWRHLDIEPEYEFSTKKHLKKSYRLKPDAVQQWIPMFAGLDEDVDFHDTSPEARAKLQKYNDRDNVRAWTISKLVWAKMTPGQRNACLIQFATIPLVAQANLDGLPIDYLTVKHLAAKLDGDAVAMLHDLAPEGMTEVIVRSPMKLGQLMFDEWKLPVLKENKSKALDKDGNPKPNSRSTDKEVLHELAFIDPRARKVKLYREALNARGKFCESVIESLVYNEDGRTHPSAKLFGTYTDRMTVSSKQGKNKAAVPIGFALHQMKREKEFREIVCAAGPDEYAPEGYDIMEFDAAGQEFRWMAVASGDPVMLGLCQPGEDPHSYMGARIVNRDYRELVRLFATEDKIAVQNRYLGKFANLSLQYRTSARKLRVKARIDYNIPMELPEAQRIHATYQRAYPGVPVYWERQIAIVKACGYVETFGGNRVRVEGNWGGEWGWSMGSTAINTRIQGTGADQKHLALKVITPILRKYNGRFLFDLHDGLYLLVPCDKRMQAAVEMKRALDNLPYQREWGFTPPIPMPWDCKVGKAWGRLKELKFD